MPSGYCFGSSNVAVSRTRAGSSTMISAFTPSRISPRSEPEPPGGKRGHLTHRLFKLEDLTLAHVMAEHAWECAMAAWMRHAGRDVVDRTRFAASRGLRSLSTTRCWYYVPRGAGT